MNLLSNAIKYTKSRKTAVIEVGGYTEGEKPSTTSRTTASALMNVMPTNCSASSSGCTAARNTKAPASAWPSCSASCSATAAASGPKGKVGEGATFYFALPRE